MDLQVEKKHKFDAFQGNSLAKPNNKLQRRKTTSTVSLSTGVMKGSTLKIPDQYNFDMMWKGSVSNLMSSENITEDLIKESIKELELAMQESKRMLVERDDEILRLREHIDNNKLALETSSCPNSSNISGGYGDGYTQQSILKQLEESENRNALLEKRLHDVQLAHSQEITRLKNEQKAPPIWHIEDVGSNSRPECTCHCGSVCKALHDLVETKQSLEHTKAKYDNLKKRVKEFRRHNGLDQQRNKNAFGNGVNSGNYGQVNDDRSSCSIQ